MWAGGGPRAFRQPRQRARETALRAVFFFGVSARLIGLGTVACLPFGAFARYWFMLIRIATPLLAGLCFLCAVGDAAAQGREVYRCPGNLYTDQISPKEAVERGCKTLSGAPVTVVQTPPRRAPTAPGASAAPGRPENRIDPAEQRARDSDARRILEAELRKEEERLAQLHKDLVQGEAERRGDERNFARYQERVPELKAAVARKEADVAAIRRELAKQPAP